MRSFFLCLRSEFLKTRKTPSIWITILLPFVICSLVSIGFYAHSDKMAGFAGAILWMRFMGAVLGAMGILLLPMFVIFITYSVNNIEHRADTWKSLFSLPIPKWTIYSSKFTYAVLLNALCIGFFALFIVLDGNFLHMLKPELKFNEHQIISTVFQIHVKLFLSSLGILAIQFLLSLIWSDFLKPMGLGFVATVAGITCSQMGWEYAWAIPYSHPMLALAAIKPGSAMTGDIDLFTKEVVVSLIVGAATFVLGFFVVSKRSIK